MDAVRHYGGEPANFLEIGGESYRLGRPALELVLSNPNVKSLLVNFCGAFARTDVMTGGILEAWEALKPTVPVFFTIHGTGDTVTPFAGVVAFREAMIEAGNRCEVIAHEGGIHGYMMFNRQLYLETLATTERFLESLNLLDVQQAP